MTKKAIQILMGLAIIFTSLSVICDCEKQKCTDAINGNWYIAIEKTMLSIDANIDKDYEQYDKLISDEESILNLIEEKKIERDNYAWMVYAFHILSLIFSLLALLAVFGLKEQT